MAAEYSHYDASYVPEPFGLHNTGVICWLNSILQVLLSCPALNKTLIECEAELLDNEFAKEYIRLVKAIVPNNPDSNADTGRFAGSSANILAGFIRQLRAKGRTFRIGSSQECVDEAFTLFIDLFDCQKISRLFTNVYELSITCENCKNEVSSVRDTAFKINLFGKKPLTTMEDFCTYLRIHASEHDHYKCEKCGKTMIKFYRIEKLRALREIVVIVFDKFHSKDNRWFPAGLEFDAKNGGKLRYKLVGQIEHGGTMFGGHYKCNALRGAGFKQFNDTSVGDAVAGPTHETYMIVYHIVRE